MYRYLLTPRWLALHAAVVAAVVGCIILGWWQLGVYQDSRDRSDIRALPPAPITELVQGGDPLAGAHDRRATVTGSYAADQQLLVPGRIHDDTLGSFVVTPLVTSDGLVVPVLRGWIDEPDDPGRAVPAGPVTVTGFVQKPETPDHATVRSDQPLDDDQAAYIAPDQLAGRGWPVADAIQGYLVLQAQDPEPAASPTILDINVIAPIRDVGPWQNLSYWAQWWVFGAAAIVFWASALRSANKSRRRTEVSEPAQSHVPS